MSADTQEIGPARLDLDSYRITDEFFGRPYIDRDEVRAEPARHRNVHGGFAGTDTRFNFYFPPATIYQDRLFQPMEGGHAGHENIFGEGPVAKISGGLEMAFRLGGYMLESNSGHIGDDIDPKGGNDPTIYGFRASIESARLSRHLAAQIYGKAPANGYVYGGSGGGRRSPGCIEYGAGVYTGALPYHSGGNYEPWGTKSRVRSEQPVHFGLMFNIQRLLGDRIGTLVDAMQPGGGRNPFVGLDAHARQELANLYRLGYPRGDEFMISQPFGQIWLWTSIADLLQEEDAAYFDAFWTQQGYLGHDEPQFVERDLIDAKVTVKRTMTARELRDNPEFADPAIQSAAYPALFIAMLNHTMDLPMAVEVEGLPGGYRRGAGVYIKSGKATGRRLYAMAEAKNIFFLDGRGDANLLRLSDVEPGDDIHIDNHAFLAYCYYYRHHISDDPICDFLRVDGQPIYPQHDVPLASPLMGVPYCGQYEGKVMWIHATHDASLWPPQGLTYLRAVEKSQGADGVANNFCIRWTENAEHTPPTMVPAQPNRSAANWLIGFQGIIEQGLVDLIDWVEHGKKPVGTNFSFSDGKVRLPSTAEERGGIQPVVSLTANDAERTQAAIGQPVSLRVVATVPPGAGTIIAVEWDFDGEGKFPLRQEVTGKDRSVNLEVTHAFDRAGTFFPTARITAHRDGDLTANFRLIQNLASARVVVG